MKQQSFERYKYCEESEEEALIEMYLAGVSVQRVEDISEALRGAKVSPGTIRNLNHKAFAQIEEWRNRKLEVEYPNVYLRREDLSQEELGWKYRENRHADSPWYEQCRKS